MKACEQTSSFRCSYQQAWYTTNETSCKLREDFPKFSYSFVLRLFPRKLSTRNCILTGDLIKMSCFATLLKLLFRKGVLPFFLKQLFLRSHLEGRFCNARESVILEITSYSKRSRRSS